MEEWRLVLKGFYEISNLGRIRRAKPGKRTWVGRLLKTSASRDGYVKVIVSLGVNRKQKTVYIHQLVAEAFIGPRPLGKETNHKDGVKANCSVKNLEYLTKPEHERHTIKLGVRAHGERHPLAKLTVAKVRRIRRLVASGKRTIRSFARELSMNETTIQSVVYRQTWRHI